MHGQAKILFDVSETSSRLNVKHSCGSVELEIEYLRF